MLCVPMTAARIVSLVPSTTESVCMLGARDRLVACTSYCTEPEAALVGVARIGGTKNPSRERIAQLRPDLVLCNTEENRAEDIAWCRERFAVLEQAPCTVIQAAEALRELAVQLDALPAVEPFLLRIEAQLAAAAVENLDRRPLRVFYAIWQKPWMSINRTTFIHDVLRVCGAANVCADDGSRYPEITPEAVQSRGPRFLLLPDEPWEFGPEAVEDLQRAETFGDAQLVLCRGRDFCWHGVHMAEGLGNVLALMRQLRRGGGGDGAR
jgi:ABC-type Fe3+-hydroxamate transport system substrate-binding protein